MTHPAQTGVGPSLYPDSRQTPSGAVRRYRTPLTARLTANPPPKEGSGRENFYHYDVVIDGENIVKNSRDPEHDLARVLLARGINGEVRVIDGVTGKHRTTVNIEATAKFSVEDGERGARLRNWKPYPEKAMTND